MRFCQLPLGRAQGYNSGDKGGAMDESSSATPDGTGTVPQPEPGGTARSSAVRVWVWVIAALVAVALGVGGYFGVQALLRTQRAEAAIADASALLDGAEEDLLIVDAAVQAEISSEVATSSAEAIERAAKIRKDFVEASELVADALPEVPEDRKLLATALKESADARSEMMQIAPEILKADVQAATAMPLADQAVAEIKAAEDLSAQAVAEFNKHTAASVKASDDLSLQAEARLAAAASLLTSATAAFPGADFTPFQAYVTAKIELIALAKEIDALWLGGKVADSNAKLAAYNQKDAEIVAMAQALPASVRDPIANSYTAVTADASARYFDARERARSAGERVRRLKESPAE